MRTRLKSLSISGYKSFKNLELFEPKNLNILIGANGAGKSNLISFFRMLSYMMNSPGELQVYIAQQGGAGKILHDSATVTNALSACLCMETEAGENDYAFTLAYAAGDNLIFTDEKYRYSAKKFNQKRNWTILLPMGHHEARIIEKDENGDTTANTIRKLLKRCVIFQFHNTSMTARMRGKWRTEDNWFLKEDAGNIAAILYRMKNNEPHYYKRIIEFIRAGLPFFADFEIEDVYGSVLLQWRERGSDLIFDASQASDGMLRFIALVVLLAQPTNMLPDVLVLDEPELGLHPYAIEIVSGLLKSATREIQALVATQSETFIDHFDTEDIVVVERQHRISTLKRHTEEELKDWLDTYSISQLWEKNVLGGKPSL